MPETVSRDSMFGTLLAQLTTGVVVADRDGKLEIVNSAASALFADVRAREPIDWIVARVLLTGEIVRDEEALYLGVHNEWRTLSISATPLEDEPGHVTHAIVTFEDVTDRNRGREWEPVMRALSRL